MACVKGTLGRTRELATTFVLRLGLRPCEATTVDDSDSCDDVGAEHVVVLRDLVIIFVLGVDERRIPRPVVGTRWSPILSPFLPPFRFSPFFFRTSFLFFTFVFFFSFFCRLIICFAML
jgi:hypothetical protein